MKIFKKNKEGLQGRFKIIGQVLLGICVGAILYFNPDVTLRTDVTPLNEIENTISVPESKNIKATLTTIPMLKNNEFDYHSLIAWTGKASRNYVWLVFIPIVIFIITAVSNGANLTDGIDGLAAGTSAIIVFCFRCFCVGIRKCKFCGIFKYNVYPKCG